MYHLRRVSIIAIFVVATWFALGTLYNYLNPNENLSDEEREDAEWIASSKYWLDRQSCRWLGLCGLAHWHPDPATKPWNKKRAGELWERAGITDGGETGLPPIWEEIPGQGERLRPGDWDGHPQVLKDIPQFVLDNAPLIHLYSGEQFWPSDIRDHLRYMEPYENFTTIQFGKDANLHNLVGLNKGRRGQDLFMHSKEDVEDRPDWLSSAYNKPIPYDDEPEEVEDIEDMEYTEFSSGETPTKEDLETWFDPYGPQHKTVEPLNPTFRTQPSRHTKNSPIRKRNQSLGIEPVLPKPGGYSPAPAVLVLVDKGQGILDAFWFYFYSYNLGTTVLGIRFGNHVGDWEHSLIRFYNGVPKAIFFSAHSGGIAYSHKAVEKGKGPGREGRPVLYSALGSHAMYAQPGSHPYVLPFGMLADVTDKGPLWDPALNYLAYHYNTSITHDVDAKSVGVLSSTHHDSFQPAASNPKAEVGWWWFNGHWGDKFYELSDRRQWRFAGQYHYVNGPLGPRFKNLGRSRVCQSRGTCLIVDSLMEGKKRSWIG